MSAEIIAFVPRLRGLRPAEVRNVFRSLPRVDDLVMDHTDTAPCEYVAPCERDDQEPA